MTDHLPRLIRAFDQLDVIVIGEAMLDSYLEGDTGRLCREAPVPIVRLNGRSDAPGGAANSAVNARSLGARVHLLSVVGDDPEAALLGRALQARGVDTAGLRAQPGRRTLAKQRVVAASQLLLRFDQGTTDPVDPASERWLIDRLADLYPRSDAAIISDYGYGILTPRVIAALADLQARHPLVLVADSKDLAAYRKVGLTAAKPNYAEALQLLGLDARDAPGPRPDRIAGSAGRILERTGARIAAVTIDTEGALIVERDRPPYRTYARPEYHARAAGAGDTFLAALALGLAAGGDTPAASELASAASAVVVSQEGTVACSAVELLDRLAPGAKPAADLDTLVDRLDAERRRGRRIVFTNGCFDILHRGHVTYLGQAKALGDILVVGVNSDAGIRRLKGPDRPINTLEDRVEVLAALSCVDHLIPFDDDTPCALIRALRPDVFVKGGDYTRDRLPEAALVEELGGVVRILPFLPERSTTRIIERIQTTYTRPDAVASVPALADGVGGRP
jgi:D-beta-D-heptose 7-phosphate kinase/D-beta-D-heptose 1-phosphate adenosyltransferase